MPVKRYEVDGNPYDVSEAKEQEFLSKFSNAVLIGVLDEDTNEVLKQDETQDFPTSTVEDADAVQQPMTASQAGFTESPSVDTPSDSQDPADKDFTLEQFKLMTPEEKNALSYSEKQRLSREKNNEKKVLIKKMSTGDVISKLQESFNGL